VLKLAEDLSLPIDTVTQSMAILARRGAGKTYTGSVLAEEVMKAGVPIVILDPTGAWWGLRSSADGKSEGLPVTIFGGDHGDLALEATAGALIAEVVLEHPGAYILDFSAFTSKTAEQTFAASFLEHLYRGKKAETGPLLVVVDEADMFAPQRPGPEQTKSLGALESIVRRGRIKGLGCLLITQRAAVLNKNVLTQTEILIIMQTTGPQDRKAMDEWIIGNAKSVQERDDVLFSLASMKQGEAWIWSPSFLHTLVRVQIKRRETFDSSNTPGAGQTRIVPTKFAQVDLEKLGERIAATIEKQAENDPRRLKAEISRLERELKVAQTTNTVEKIVEVPVLPADFMEKVPQVAELMSDYGQKILDAIASLPHQTKFPAGTPVKEVVAELMRPVHEVLRERTAGLTTITADTPVPSNGEIKIGKAERTILTALAHYPDGVSKRRLSLLTGYSEDSGHTKNTLGKLRSVGYINRGDPIQITRDGLEALGSYEAIPLPGPELVQYWMTRLGLAERRMLDTFVGAYPNAITKEFLGEATGYSPDSGHFKNTLGRIRGLGLVDGWTASVELMG
jgi:hypothetical protein